MMVKYRIYEVAKDLGSTSKDIIKLVKDYTGVEKKHMTALSEEELNIIFEYYTQHNQVESFDEYFAQAPENPKTTKTSKTKESTKEKKTATKKEPAKNSKKIEDKTSETKKTKSKSAATKEQKEPDKAIKSSNNAKNPKKVTEKQKESSKDKKTASTQKLSHKNESSSPKKVETFTKRQKNPQVNQPVRKLERRVVDTRSAHVDIEKYNEKYDRLASEKMRTDNFVHKQKINQRSQMRGKLRNSKKETEAERLKRIALERKNKPLTISIPDEITVGDLALKLKATAAEVIK